MKRALAMVAFILFAFRPALAHENFYSVILDGPSEAPPNASPGTGTALVTVDLDLITMRVELSFSGLTGTTSASHIHGNTTTPGAGTAIVATQTPTFTGFPLGVTAGTYDHTFDMTLASSYNSAYIAAHGGTVATAFNDLIAGMDQGRTYLNVHTSTFPGGEIRGFLQAIPEPSSCGLLLLGGIALVRRRRAGR